MKLIVGLGNPGDIYAQSRHNIGFSVVKALAKNHKGVFKKERNIQGLAARVRIRAQRVILAMPLTFMNLSGRCVVQLIRKHKLDLEDLLVVCDDLDLEMGRLKLRARGSSGGHRGLESIAAHLESQEFARLRVGIGRPLPGLDAAEFVLSCFTREEARRVKQAVDKACACCVSWPSAGVTKTMNIFNKRSEKE
ncbi:MAG: aminoacyl-tRNA hydrolase [Candidatus Omnitrophota bacterium]